MLSPQFLGLIQNLGFYVTLRTLVLVFSLYNNMQYMWFSQIYQKIKHINHTEAIRLGVVSTLEVFLVAHFSYTLLAC